MVNGRARSRVGAVLLAASWFGLMACTPANELEADARGAGTAPLSSDGPSAQLPSQAPPLAVGAAEPASSPITLYTVSGTFAGAERGYPADVARAVDPHSYTWERVRYPGAAFPMNLSVDLGVSNLVDLIRSHPGKFALVGYSQGAIVTSRVYDMLRSGDLQDRRQDLVAGVTFGNPMREAGHTIPGGTDPGGHGIMRERLANTESLWWDFANPNDIACTIGDDALGRQETGIFEALLTNFTGPESLGSVIQASFMDPAVRRAQGPALVDLVMLGVGWITDKGSFSHSAYEVTRPIAGRSHTSVELAIEYLNEAAH